MEQLGKFIKQPRPDTSIGTPLIRKEGKVSLYNTTHFSSFARRSTLTEVSGGGGWLFKEALSVILLFFV
ncbi:MAG: hypothetical protein NTY95_03725, partial [Bacteroidia bacterium]|nr:hypothetical protein [Bacteroidia bacterium]